MKKLISRVFTADSTYSVGEKIAQIIIWAFPVTVSAVMGWIAAESVTFWQNFGLLGVAGMAVVTFFLVAAGLALTADFLRFRDQRKASVEGGEIDPLPAGPAVPVSPPPSVGTGGDLTLVGGTYKAGDGGPGGDGGALTIRAGDGSAFPAVRTPSPATVKTWVPPMSAAKLWADPAHERNIVTAQAVVDGVERQHSEAEAKLSELNMRALRALAKPKESPSAREMEDARAVVTSLSAHLKEAKTTLQQHTWRQLWDMVHQLQDGRLIAEGFRNPADTDEVRIKATEWRKYSPEENELWFKRAKLGDNNYTGVMIGKPEQ